MRALVTGAAGFIGSHVVRALVGAGHQVRALHLPGDDLRNLRGLPVELAAGDVTDRASVDRAVADVDWVFHLAAIYALWLRRPERMRQVNVGGTRNLLEAARDAGVQRVVYTSSIAVFGGQGPGRDATEQSDFALASTGDLYSRTKYESHQVATRMARQLDITIVAPCGPIGPGDVGPTPTGRLLLASLRAPVMVAVDTETSFADVRDMAAAHLAAAERGRRGESYLLGKWNLPVARLATIAQQVTGRRTPVVTLPPGLVKLAARGLVGASRLTGRPPLVTPAAVEIARLGLRADCRKAERELGLTVRPIEESVEDAVRWFVDNGYARPVSGQDRWRRARSFRRRRRCSSVAGTHPAPSSRLALDENPFA